MDKLNPVFQPTPVTAQVPASVSQWYTTETTIGVFTPSELSWMLSQGWRVTFTNFINAAYPTYALARRIIKPELVLGELVADYTAAYNEGRALNDQRYDDLVVLYTSMLDKTEDTFNANATLDDTHKANVEAIIAAMQAAYTAYAIDVDGDLDTWGADTLARINAAFAAEQSKASIALIDRGLNSSLLAPNAAAAVTREHQLALNNANDTIAQRQLELKHKVYNEGAEMRSRILLAYERLRGHLSAALDRQVAVRNAAADALARFVERREDGYPDLTEIGRLAAALGAGSPEAFSS